MGLLERSSVGVQSQGQTAQKSEQSPPDTRMIRFVQSVSRCNNLKAADDVYLKRMYLD